MRRLAWVTLVLAAAACSDSTTPSSGSTLSASDVSDIGFAEGDEVEQAASALSTPITQGVGVPGHGCATVDDATDTDGDLVPDHATYTFALPACSFTNFRGGSLDVTGTVTLSDPTPDAAGLYATATLDDLTFSFTNPDQRRTYSAVRNGTLTLSGNAQGASLSNQVTVVRSWPNRADATVTHDLLVTFTPDAGQTLAFGVPLPSGSFTRSGTFTWARGSVSLTFTVTTVAPLVWDASCTTDRKIASGETHATLSNGSYVRTVWNGCGEDPVRTLVRP